MLKHISKTKVYAAVGFVTGYYVGRRYDLVVVLKKAAK